MAQKKQTNHNTIRQNYLLFTAVAVVILIFIFAEPLGLTDAYMNGNLQKNNPQNYQSKTVDPTVFKINLAGGRPTENADFEFKVPQGKLTSFEIASDQSGIMTFTSEDEVVIARQVSITPLNQFYIPSDKLGTYKVIFDVGASASDPTVIRRASYYLGTLTITPPK